MIGCIQSFSIFGGRTFGMLFEDERKHAEIVKPALQGDVLYGNIGGGEQVFGVFQSFADQVLLWGNPAMRLEHMAEMLVRVSLDHRQFLNIYVVVKIFVDKFCNVADAGNGLLLGGYVRAAEHIDHHFSHDQIGHVRIV